MSPHGSTHRHPHEALTRRLLAAGRQERPAPEVSRRALGLAARLSPAAAAGLACATGAAVAEAGTNAAGVGAASSAATAVGSSALATGTSTATATIVSTAASGAGAALGGVGPAMLGTAAVLGKWLGIGFVCGSAMVTAVHLGIPEEQPTPGAPAEAPRLEERGNRSPSRGRSSGQPERLEPVSEAEEPRPGEPETRSDGRTASSSTALEQRMGAGASPPLGTPRSLRVREEVQPTAGRSLRASAPPDSSLKKAAAPPPAAVSLEKEMVYIERARIALGRGDAQGAQALLRTYRSTFPSGHFVPEVAALEVEARLLQGDSAGGRAAAQRFLELHPESPLAERVRKLATP